MSQSRIKHRHQIIEKSAWAVVNQFAQCGRVHKLTVQRLERALDMPTVECAEADLLGAALKLCESIVTWDIAAGPEGATARGGVVKAALTIIAKATEEGTE